jgi:hypothetical protein
MFLCGVVPVCATHVLVTVSAHVELTYTHS